MLMEIKVESMPEREARLKESGVKLVRDIIATYSRQAELYVNYTDVLPDGVRSLARQQMNALNLLLDPNSTSIESHPYMPYANSAGLDESWTQKVFGYEVFFSAPDHDTEPVSSGLYVDLEGYVHVKVGDGWSSVYGNDQTRPALENQAMKELFMEHVLNIADNAGPVIRNAQFPYMVSV